MTTALERLSEDTIADALSYVPSDERETWVRMGMAVKNEFGAGGFDVWDRWSQSAANYNQRDAKDVWRSIKAHGGVTIATLISEAQTRGFKFGSAHREIDQAELDARKAKREVEQKAEADQKRAKQAKAAQRASDIYNSAKPQGAADHPYTLKKGVQIAGQARVGSFPIWDAANRQEVWIDNTLIIPIRDSNKNLTTLQAIFPSADNLLGRDRTYLPNGKKEGGYTNIGVPKDVNDPVILVCEGYATGETLHQATGHCVFVAFDAGNLEAVAKIARKRSDQARIIICADDDRYHTDPKKKNDGLRYASQAAGAVGGVVAVPNFADRSSEPTDFNDLQMQQGAEEVAFQIQQAIEGKTKTPIIDEVELPADDRKPAANDNAVKPAQVVNHLALSTYFTVLGYDREVIYFFQHEARQMFALSRGELSSNSLISLAPLEVWAMHYPPRSSQSDFHKNDAINDLIREARRMPVFNPARVRGRGAWADNGRAVFHYGDYLTVDGEYTDIGRVTGSRYIYQAEVPFEIDTSVQPMTDAEGEQLVNVAQMFRWHVEASAALLSGWVFLSPLCGALRWRPHIWLTGGAGCGKSTILEHYVQTLTRWCNLYAQGNSTEAGIRQSLGSDAIPVLFDESEQNNDREANRMQNVLSLIRQASSESGAKTLKGTTNGTSMSFHIRSMFCLASIQVGIQQQADRERLTVLSLRSKPEKGSPEAKVAGDNWEAVKNALYLIKRDDTLPDRMFKRAVGMLPTILKAVDVFVIEAAKHFGNQRDGDQYGTLLAGTWCMMNSTVPTAAEAAQMINSYKWSEYTESNEADDSTRCLGALLESRIKSQFGGEYSVFELVDKIAADKGRNRHGAPSPTCNLASTECQGTLSRAGMMVKGDDLVISNTSQAFDRLMDGTQFRADARRLIRRVAGVRPTGKAVWIAGGTSHGIMIPIALLYDSVDDDF